MFHNGIKYLDAMVEEKNVVLAKNFLSKVHITEAFRGSFTDLQVYSYPTKEEDLKKWTICQFAEPGDVFEWNITRLNMTHDPNIISNSAKVDSKELCRATGSSKKEIHIFGDPTTEPISNLDGITLCNRLNGKMKLLPTTKKEVERLADYIRSYGGGWVGGEGSGSPHWFPDKGIFAFVDPETGESLITEENDKFITKAKHSYQVLEDICLHCCGPGERLIKCNWQKCKRKRIERVLCEFETTPAIRIKGLCKQSPINRDFQLVETNPEKGTNTYIQSNMKELLSLKAVNWQCT